MATPIPFLGPTEWVITQVNNSKALKLWFDDDNEVVNVIRGGLNSSARLMVETGGAFGFIDFNDKRSGGCWNNSLKGVIGIWEAGQGARRDRSIR
ncbi:hypothetical protein BDZ89DRAFT_1146061 [Hymenopellis radicata]|nr:hypothetical protein BDZ89DRAFT_1146061 [Hymenopellis radicata]